MECEYVCVCVCEKGSVLKDHSKELEGVDGKCVWVSWGVSGRGEGIVQAWKSLFYCQSAEYQIWDAGGGGMGDDGGRVGGIKHSPTCCATFPVPAVTHTPSPATPFRKTIHTHTHTHTQTQCHSSLHTLTPRAHHCVLTSKHGHKNQVKQSVWQKTDLNKIVKHVKKDLTSVTEKAWIID